MVDSSDFFRSLADWLVPDKLLRDPKADGSGIRLAVIDSGIDTATLRDRFAAKNQTFEPIESLLFRHDAAEPVIDENGPASPHGTIVADILLMLAPKAKLYSANVFGHTGTSEVETVVRAIDHAIHVWQVKIINLSLGISEVKLRQLALRHEFLRAIERAYHKDVLVFAAAHNEHPITRSYPSLFAPPLISVDKGEFGNPLEFAYTPREQIEFSAYSKGYLGPFAKESATSWATPHLAGIAARLLSLNPDMKPFEIKTLLYWMAKLRR